MLDKLKTGGRPGDQGRDICGRPLGLVIHPNLGKWQRAQEDTYRGTGKDSQQPQEALRF